MNKLIEYLEKKVKELEGCKSNSIQIELTVYKDLLERIESGNYE